MSVEQGNEGPKFNVTSISIETAGCCKLTANISKGCNKNSAKHQRDALERSKVEKAMQ